MSSSKSTKQKLVQPCKNVFESPGAGGQISNVTIENTPHVSTRGTCDVQLYEAVLPSYRALAEAHTAPLFSPAVQASFAKLVQCTAFATACTNLLRLGQKLVQPVYMGIKHVALIRGYSQRKRRADTLKYLLAFCADSGPWMQFESCFLQFGTQLLTTALGYLIV